MSARDDYPGLLALSEMFPDRAGGEQAQRALNEIDRLRGQVDQVRQLCDSPYGYGYVTAKIREALTDAAYEDRLQRLIDSAVDGPPTNKFGNVIDYAPQFGEEAPDPDDWLQP